MRLDSPNGKRPDGPRDAADAEEAVIVALSALGWTISDASRAERLLALTGLDADMLRAGAEDPAILGAVMSFLADHEPDLVACADAIGASPARLIAARDLLLR